MPGPSNNDPRVGIIIEPHALADVDQSVWDSSIYLAADPDEPRRETLGRMLDEQVDLVAVAGGDRLLADILTEHRRHFRSHPTPLRLFALRAGRLTQVADQLGAPPLSAKTFRRLERAARGQKLNRRLLPTLKVSSSVEPSARVGFSFGAGLFYTLFEAYHRAGASASGAPGSAGRAATLASMMGRMGKDLLVDAGRSFEPVRARLAVDARPRAEAIGYLLASSLERTWLGLSMRQEEALGLRLGDSGAELAREVAKARALPKFLRSAAGAEAFDRLHVDFNAGYVLDGELYEPLKPYVIQVEQGPVAHFVTL